MELKYLELVFLIFFNVENAFQNTCSLIGFIVFMYYVFKLIGKISR